MKYWNAKLKNMTEYIPGEQPKDINEYIKLKQDLWLNQNLKLQLQMN